MNEDGDVQLEIEIEIGEDMDNTQYSTPVDLSNIM
jgi:hypothetical protein